MCKICKEAVVACVKMMVHSLFKRTLEEYKRKMSSKIPGPRRLEYTIPVIPWSFHTDDPRFL
jgi:hypothetical protein